MIRVSNKKGVIQMGNGLPKIPASRKSGKYKLTKTQEISRAMGYIPVKHRYKAPNWRKLAGNGHWIGDKSSSSNV